ncbi:MAG: TetR/AcrR family transcriptional regulator [Phycisphaerae bacterium]
MTNKKVQIMEAAEKLFQIRRFHEITLDEVARAADVGKGTIYLYFHDKDDLFFQTATAGFDDLCRMLREKVPADAPFGRQLTDACRSISEFFARRRSLFRMIQAQDERVTGRGGGLLNRWRSHRRPMVESLARIIARGVAAGEIRSDMSAEVLAELLIGILRTRARELETAPARVRRYEVLVDFFCHGAGRKKAEAVFK